MRKSGRACDRLAQQQGDGGGFADAGGADNGEVTRQRVVDGDVGVDRLVLRERADGDRMPPGEIIDRLQVTGADAVCNGADMRIGGDAAVEDRFGAGLGSVAHFADQLDADFDRVLALIAPGAIRLADLIDQANGPCGSEIDGDHLADRPQAGNGAIDVVGIGADGGARTVALHDIAEDAPVVLLCVAALLRCRFSNGGFAFDIHG